MKLIGKIIFSFLGLVIIAVVVGAGLLGYIPALANVLGVNKPRDLGIRYTEADYKSAREKSKMEYIVLTTSTTPETSYRFEGSRPVTTSWTSEEITSLMNDRAWKYWPIEDVQFKANADGTAELSGIVIKDKLVGYARANGVPAEVINKVVEYLPQNPTFYLKGKASLKDNKINEFEPQSVYLGKMPLPVSTLLAAESFRLVSPAYAKNLLSEISQYSGKRQLIIDFINERLSGLTGFYAKSADFDGGKLNFDGTLSQKEYTAR